MKWEISILVIEGNQNQAKIFYFQVKGKFQKYREDELHIGKN
jgi:hypothetical protein